jgi:hypothetical protein
MNAKYWLVVCGVLVVSSFGCRREIPTFEDVAQDIDVIDPPTLPRDPSLDPELPAERVAVQRPIVTAEQQVEAAEELRTLDFRYDPENEITIRGSVLGKRYINLEGDHTAEVVRLQPGGDFIDVMIGTTKHLFRHDVDVGITDQILVTGSLVDVNGRRMLLARELLWSDRELVLREKDGWPLWRDRSEQEKLEDVKELRSSNKIRP